MTSQGIILALALLLLGGCAGMPERTSLYDELGRREGIEELAELLLVRTSDDPRINAHFVGVDIVNLHERLVEQICSVADGPCEYTGKNMADAHSHVDVSNADFNALVENLMWAMDQRGIRRVTQNRLLARLAPMHRDVVR